jgi:hypothetical protein
MALNAAWHRAHPMPKNPTRAERTAWHVEHARECACRPVPLAIQAQLRDLGGRPPKLAPPARRRPRS